MQVLFMFCLGISSSVSYCMLHDCNQGIERFCIRQFIRTLCNRQSDAGRYNLECERRAEKAKVDFYSCLSVFVAKKEYDMPTGIDSVLEAFKHEVHLAALDEYFGVKNNNYYAYWSMFFNFCNVFEMVCRCEKEEPFEGKNCLRHLIELRKQFFFILKEYIKAIMQKDIACLKEKYEQIEFSYINELEKMGCEYYRDEAIVKALEKECSEVEAINQLLVFRQVYANIVDKLKDSEWDFYKKIAPVSFKINHGGQMVRTALEIACGNQIPPEYLKNIILKAEEDGPLECEIFLMLCELYKDFFVETLEAQNEKKRLELLRNFPCFTMLGSRRLSEEEVEKLQSADQLIRRARYPLDCKCRFILNQFPKVRASIFKKINNYRAGMGGIYLEPSLQKGLRNNMYPIFLHRLVTEFFPGLFRLEHNCYASSQKIDENPLSKKLSINVPKRKKAEEVDGEELLLKGLLEKSNSYEFVRKKKEIWRQKEKVWRQKKDVLRHKMYEHECYVSRLLHEANSYEFVRKKKEIWKKKRERRKNLFN